MAYYDNNDGRLPSAYFAYRAPQEDDSSDFLARYVENLNNAYTKAEETVASAKEKIMSTYQLNDADSQWLDNYLKDMDVKLKKSVYGGSRHALDTAVKLAGEAISKPLTDRAAANKEDQQYKDNLLNMLNSNLIGKLTHDRFREQYPYEFIATYRNDDPAQGEIGGHIKEKNHPLPVKDLDTLFQYAFRNLPERSTSTSNEVSSSTRRDYDNETESSMKLENTGSGTLEGGSSMQSVNKQLADHPLAAGQAESWGSSSTNSGYSESSSMSLNAFAESHKNKEEIIAGIQNLSRVSKDFIPGAQQQYDDLKWIIDKLDKEIKEDAAKGLDTTEKEILKKQYEDSFYVNGQKVNLIDWLADSIERFAQAHQYNNTTNQNVRRTSSASGSTRKRSSGAAFGGVGASSNDAGLPEREDPSNFEGDAATITGERKGVNPPLKIGGKPITQLRRPSYTQK